MNSRYKDKLVGVYAPGNYGHTSVNDAINKLHYLRGIKYRNSRMYRVEMEEVEG